MDTDAVFGAIVLGVLGALVAWLWATAVADRSYRWEGLVSAIENAMIRVGDPLLTACRALTGRPRPAFHPGPSRLRTQRQAMADWEDRFAGATGDGRRFAVDPSTDRVYVSHNPEREALCKGRYAPAPGADLAAILAGQMAMAICIAEAPAYVDEADLS